MKKALLLTYLSWMASKHPCSLQELDKNMDKNTCMCIQVTPQTIKHKKVTVSPPFQSSYHVFISLSKQVSSFYSPLNDLSCTRTAAFLSEDHHLLICGKKSLPGSWKCLDQKTLKELACHVTFDIFGPVGFLRENSSQVSDSRHGDGQ